MDKIWVAKWITNDKFIGLSPINVFKKEYASSYLPTHKEELKNQHMLVRKTFTINKQFSNAILDVTADDYYKLYVNGKYVGEGPAPGYYFHYYYNQIDITSFLTEGENVIALHLYYQGLINRVWNSGDYRQGMIAELFIDNELFLVTDKTWKYTLTKAYQGNKIIGYDTQYLEDIDSRLVFNGWKSINFNDGDWQSVWENKMFDHKLFLQHTPLVTRYKIKPHNVVKLNQDHYFMDFGQEITGLFWMSASGVWGEQIEIRCGEELLSDNTVRYNLRCNCLYQEFWTLSGTENEPLEFYDYKAFRYVEVIGRGINVDSFSALVRHYPFDESTCQLTSSNELLNQIWELCKKSVKYGSQEVYVDCPTREKGQYLGDMTITGLSHIYLTNDLRLYKKALEDFSYSTLICQGMMAVTPGSLMQEIADYSLQYPMQVLTYYKHSGDIEFLRLMLPICEGIIKHFEGYARADLLLENVKGKWNLVDWPENLRDGYDFNLSRPVSDGCHNVINAFYYGAIKDTNQIKTILGLPFDNNLPQIKAAFIKAFYNQESGLFNDAIGTNHSSLHANVLPLLFDLVPEESIKTIVQLIKQKQFSCGVYFAFFVLKALANVKEYTLVYELITQTSKYSWANMIKEGATTTFEAWGKDQKWNTSLCHPWASAPIALIIEDLIGLEIVEPGFKTIRVKPNLPKTLMLEFKLKLSNGTINFSHVEGTYQVNVSGGIKLIK